MAWVTHGTGIVHNDPARHISIPPQLTMPLQVQAAYNGGEIWFRYRWPAPTASIFHDVLRYSGGKWEVHATFYVPDSTLILLAAATVVMAALGLLSRPLRGG